MSQLPDADLARLLLEANRAVERLMLERLDQAGVPGLRMGHLTLLRVLPHDGAGRLSDLAAAAGVTRQAIAQIVADLAAKGIVEVKPDPADRRARMVQYTQTGRRGHIKALEAFMSIERDLLSELGPRRLSSAKAGLAAITRASNQLTAPGEPDTRIQT
jgi:DNA-binding MarR family transcriptional regulator